MALQISDLKIYVSGGATNADPLLSLGGVKSSLNAGVVLSQNASPPTLVTGVTINNAYANPLGAGTLLWNATTGVLSWKPFGGVQDNGVVITVSGVYVIGDASGYLVVTVDLPSLPGATTQDVDIIITNRMNNVFDSVSALESIDGRIEYRCLYIHNTHSTDTAYDVRLWVKQQPIGPDELDLSLDPAGIGNGSTTGVAIGPLVDEIDTTNLLTALVWTRPGTQVDGLLLGNFTPGDCYAFWERRIVPPETTQQVSNDTSRIGISALL